MAVVTAQQQAVGDIGLFVVYGICFREGLFGDVDNVCGLFDSGLLYPATQGVGI